MFFSSRYLGAFIYIVYRELLIIMPAIATICPNLRLLSPTKSIRMPLLNGSAGAV